MLQDCTQSQWKQGLLQHSIVGDGLLRRGIVIQGGVMYETRRRACIPQSPLDLFRTHSWIGTNEKTPFEHSVGRYSRNVHLLQWRMQMDCLDRIASTVLLSLDTTCILEESVSTGRNQYATSSVTPWRIEWSDRDLGVILLIGSMKNHYFCYRARTKNRHQ